MLKYILPAQEDFFDLFQKIADELLNVAGKLQELTKQLDKPQSTFSAIQEHGQKAHEITSETFEKLHRTFITPFDRYDMHRLVKKLDVTVAGVQRTASRIVIYKLTQLPSEIIEMITLGVTAAETIRKAIGQLHSLKNAAKIIEKTDRVNASEEAADKFLLSGVSKLFDEETDVRQLLKVKDIYEHTKYIHLGYEAISNIIKDIVLEYS